ncbi:hypothetical protein BCR42DRAFT_411751 [Absidia repens]|uniref:Arrestin C-terminal-like domain-containing protein n=1 Tax=Absidia repens TaxID=90262 RepID=A0A1X2IM62_9FUNG|nr:hypothetical protein BCR42DRAFT_411751 [Absidia repens]
MSQQITTRLVLDVHRPYFPGESILGKVMLACPRTITPHAIRLIWTGGITIRPTLQDHDKHIYFRRTYAISDEQLHGRKIGNGVAYKSSAFVENSDTTKPLQLTLEESVTYSFAFDVKVPSDIPLPSSTEAESSMLGGKIVYTIEANVDFIKDDPNPAQSHVMVTVLEHMDVRLPELTVPRSEESVCALWLPHTPLASPCNYRTAMRVTIPCQASTRGGQVEIVIHLWHSVEFQRKKGAKVSLIRLRQLHFNGSVYAFPDETVLAMRADVDLKQDKNFMQTLRCNLPIRDDLTPSISDSAKLLEISYKVQIKVQLQEGTYQSLDGDCKDYMAVELPFLIGTVPLMTRHWKAAPRKSLPSSGSTSGSKKSFDTNDNDNGSMLSAEPIGKQDSSPTEPKSSKNKSKGGKKKGTLRDIFRLPGSKTPKKDTIITTDSSTQSSSSNYLDSGSNLSRSRTSSTKNTDPDPSSLTPDDSNTSYSTPSPTTAESKSPHTIQTQQHAFFEPRNIRPSNTYPYSPDDEITTSPYGLKPDEKDNEYFDSEQLAAINKSKADAIATAPITSPIDGAKLPPPRLASLTRPGTDKFTPDQLLPDNDDDDHEQAFESTPATFDDDDNHDDDLPKKTHRVHYHDIFGSSGEEDSDADADDNGGEKGKYTTGDNITKDNDDAVPTTINKPDDIAKQQQQQQRDGEGSAPLPSFSKHNQLPSPPMDQMEFNKVHEYTSDSSSDDSPINVLSKQSRQQRHKYTW